MLKFYNPGARCKQTFLLFTEYFEEKCKGLTMDRNLKK